MTNFNNRMTGQQSSFVPATETVEEWKARYLKELAVKKQQNRNEIEDEMRQLVGKYSVGFDDGAHYNELDTFDTLEDANKCLLEEIKVFQADPEDYAGSKPDEWDDTFYPHFDVGIYKLDADGEVDVETLNVWTPLDGFS